MAPQDMHPLELKQRADGILEKAAQELKELLQDAAGAVGTFPLFPGTPTHAIEAEPMTWDPSQRGCIVVIPDGELKELTMSVNPTMDGHLFPMDDLKEAHLSTMEYLIYAHGGVQELSKFMEEKRRQARRG